MLDPSGEVVEQTQIPTNPIAVQRFFERVERGRVAMEVGTHSSWIDELVGGLGHDVFVANARKLRAIWDSDKKTDRTDAYLLAEIVQLKPSLLRPIKHRGEEARNDLKLVHARCSLVRARTSLVNHVRGTVKSMGSRMPACDADAFHKTVGELPEEVKYILEPMVKQIGEITALIRGYDKAIEEKAAEDPMATLLTRVPGVGALTALAFVSTVEDPNRFPQTRKIGSYLGLRPRLDESCTIVKQLRITKAGDKYLRQLLVNSAHYILGPFGPDTDLRRWGLKLAETGGKNAKKRAVVAVARKLSVLLLTLWKSGEAYDPLRQAKRRNAAVAAGNTSVCDPGQAMEVGGSIVTAQGAVAASGSLGATAKAARTAKPARKVATAKTTKQTHKRQAAPIARGARGARSPRSVTTRVAATT